MLEGFLNTYKTFLNENSIKLIKESNYYTAKIRLSKKCVEISYDNVDYLKGKINNFLCVMASNCQYFSKENFINNFKNLKIKQLSKDELEKAEKTNICSSHDANKNLIVLKQVKDDDIFHEFLHFSSRKKSDVFFSGLCYYVEDVGYIGKGIDEGYTEILRERYFNIDLKKTGYLYEYQMTKILEMIIGKEKMEYAYFKGSILDIINELSNYCSLEEAKEFIDNMDKMVALLKKKEERFEKIRKVLLDKNYTFLKKCLENKNSMNKKIIYRGEL